MRAITLKIDNGSACVAALGASGVGGIAEVARHLAQMEKSIAAYFSGWDIYII